MQIHSQSYKSSYQNWSKLRLYPSQLVNNTPGASRQNEARASSCSSGATDGNLQVEVLRKALELWLAQPPPDPGVAVDFFVAWSSGNGEMDRIFLCFFFFSGCFSRQKFGWLICLTSSLHIVTTCYKMVQHVTTWQFMCFSSIRCNMLYYLFDVGTQNQWQNVVSIRA